MVIKRGRGRVLGINRYTPLCCAYSLSCFQYFVVLWTTASQGPLFMGILQARILELVAMPSSRGSSQPKNMNSGLLHCRRILYRLSHQGSPRILEWVAYPFSRWSSWPRNSTRVSCIAGGLFYQLSYKGSPILWGVSTLAFLGSAYNLWTNNFQTINFNVFVLQCSVEIRQWASSYPDPFSSPSQAALLVFVLPAGTLVKLWLEQRGF